MPGAANWEFLHLVRALGGERFDKAEWADNLGQPYSDNLRVEAAMHELLDALAAGDTLRRDWTLKEFERILAVEESSFGGSEPFSQLYADRKARVLLALHHVADAIDRADIHRRTAVWLRQYVALLALGQSAEARDLEGPADWRVGEADAGRGCELIGRGVVWATARPGIALAGRRSWMRSREPWGEPQGFVSALSPALASAMGRAEPGHDVHGYAALGEALRNRGWLAADLPLWPLWDDEQRAMELVATEARGAVAEVWEMVTLPMSCGLHVLRGDAAVVSWLDSSPPSDKPPAMARWIRHADGVTGQACASPGWYNQVSEERCDAVVAPSEVRLEISAAGREPVRVEVFTGRVLWHLFVGPDGPKLLSPAEEGDAPVPSALPAPPSPPITGADGPSPAPARRKKRDDKTLILGGGVLAGVIAWLLGRTKKR